MSDRANDLADHQPDHPASHPTDHLAGHRTTDRTTDRTSDRTTDRTTDRTSDRTTDRTTDRTSDRASDRTSDRADERASDRADEQADDRAEAYLSTTTENVTTENVPAETDAGSGMRARANARSDSEALAEAAAGSTPGTSTGTGTGTTPGVGSGTTPGMGTGTTPGTTAGAKADPECGPESETISGDDIFGRVRTAAHAWTRSGRNWTTGFWVFVTVAGVHLLTTGSLEPVSRIIALLSVVTLALTFHVLRPDLIRPGSERSDVAYLVTAALSTGLACAVDPGLALLLGIVFPQVGLFAPDLKAAAQLTGLVGISAILGLMTAGDWSAETAEDVLPIMILSTGFTLAINRWVTRIIEQSAERSALIVQLETTQAKLAEAHHVQGVQAERERVAREIHDTLAQGYTSIIMLAQVAQKSLPPGPARERLVLIEEVARENLGEARSLVAASAPVSLDGATLTDAVRRLVSRFGAETGMIAQVSVAGEPAGLSRDGEVVLLRSAQEALANVRRHSGARSVTVGLNGTEAGSILEVVDDGAGFDPQEAGRPQGFGLTGMRDRAEACGGELTVASAPGRGTRIAVWVPKEKVVP